MELHCYVRLIGDDNPEVGWHNANNRKKLHIKRIWYLIEVMSRYC